MFSEQDTQIDYSKLQKITEDFFILKNQKPLGKGAFGEVFKGWQKSQKRFVAIKKIPRQKFNSDQIQTLKALSSLVHQNIVGFYGFEKIDEFIYVFVELCKEEDLLKVLKKGLTQSQVLVYFRKMVEAMCYMNSKNKMHRDLKPENILIGIKGDLKINDFGLARSNQNQNIFMSSRKGTALYAAPQVFLITSSGYTQKCDVWAGGLILYEMLTGKKLFDHVKSYNQLIAQWKTYQTGYRRVKYSEKFHPFWEYFTNIMVCYDPIKRPTYHEVLQILKKVYEIMQEQIKQDKIQILEKNNPPKLRKVEKYLSFQTQKYYLLIKTYQRLNKGQIFINKAVNYSLRFLCIAKYLRHMKELIQDLRFKSFNLPGSNENLIQDQKKDFNILFCMNKYRNIIETQFTHYSHVLNHKILKLFSQNFLKNQNQFFTENKEIFTLINDLVESEGIYDVEQSYDLNLKKLVSSKYLQQDQQKLNSWSEQNLKTYLCILLCATLEKSFPASNNYEISNFMKKQLDKILEGDKKDCLTRVKTLRELFK